MDIYIYIYIVRTCIHIVTYALCVPLIHLAQFRKTVLYVYYGYCSAHTRLSVNTTTCRVDDLSDGDSVCK